MSKESEGLRMWSVSVTREVKGPFWRYPMTQCWRSKEFGGFGFNFRLGWRMTAWGLHLTRKHLTEQQIVKLKRTGEP